MLNHMACIYPRFVGELSHCRAVFSENLHCTSLHLQRAGNGRIIMSIERLSQMFQEWRNFIFGWLASLGRKTEKGSVVFELACAMQSLLGECQASAVGSWAWGCYHRPGKCKAKY